MKTLILLRVLCVPTFLTGLFFAVPAFGQSRAAGQSAIPPAKQQRDFAQSAQQSAISTDTVLVSRKAVESSIETLQKVNEQEQTQLEELKKHVASPALTGKERLQLQLQIETAIENLTQRSTVIWTLQGVLQDSTLWVRGQKTEVRNQK